MAVIIRLAELRSRDTAQVHEALADLARRGEVLDSMVMYRLADGRELSAFSGKYKASPAHAVNAAMRLGVRLTRLQDAEPTLA